jgi:hypothetical protein
MSTQVQLKRGTATQNNTYTGAIGELTVDTTSKQLRLHDGVTAGGTTIGGASSTSTNLLGGALGQIPYQTGSGATAFIGTGTQYSILQMGANTASFVTTSSIQVGYSANILAGGNGALHYQSAPNVTSFLSTGTPGQLLVAAVGAPAFTSTSSIYVNSARFADEITGGGNGSLVYQLNANDTQFLSTGTPGQILVAAVGAPAFTNTSTFLVGYAVNDAGGAAGSIRYQSAASTSAFLGIGTAGQFLTVNAGATAPQWTTTSTAQIGYAINLSGGGNGAILYQNAPNTTSFLSTGTPGQLLVAAVGAPAFTNTTTVQVGYAANVLAGGNGSLHYQSAPNVTSFLSTGTPGQLLVSGVGAPTFTNTTTVQVGFATTASVLLPTSTSTTQVGYAANLLAGAAGSLPYQSAGNATAMLALGTAGFVLTAGGSAPQWTSLGTISAGNSTTATNITGGVLGQIPFQTAPGVTSFIGTGSQFTILQMGANTASFVTTSNIQVGYAANDLGGAAGSVRYQSGANASTFLSIGTAGQFLTVNAGATAPQWTTTSTAQIGYSANLLAGTVGQVPFQSAANATSYFGPGTSGQILVSAGASATGPVFTNTSSFFIGYAGSISGGGNGALHYQSAPNVTSFLSTGTPNQILVAGVGAPAFTSTTTIQVGYSANILAGTAGQLHYQSAANTTAFVGPGTAGQLLVSAGAAIPVYTNTTTIQVGYAANVLGGAAGSIHYQTAANATGMLAVSGTPGAVLASNGVTPAYVTQVTVTATGVASASQAVGQSLVVSAGGLGVSGNSYFANQLTVASTASSTATLSANSLYVAGGIGVAYDLTVGRNAVVSGNLTVNGVITGTNAGIVVNQVTATSGVFLGDATGNGALYAGVSNYTPFGQTMFQATGNFNDYMEINVQNVNSGAKASTDIVASADNVTLGNAFIDMGITSSQWDGTQANSLGTALSPNDGYLLVGKNATAGNGDLVFGTTTTGTQMKFVVAVTATTVTNTMVAVTMNRWDTPTLSTASGTLIVTGGVGVSGGVFVGGTVTGTNLVITGVTSATSTLTGALRVVGGAGIGGALYAGNIYTNGAQVLPTSIQEFTATAGQTTFTISGGYTVGQIQVYANGVNLASGDYTASNGTSVVLNNGRNTNDIVRVVVSQNYAVNAQQAYTFNQYTSNGTTTTFATTYNTATVQVYQNGTLQMPTTYTANNGSSVIFSSIPANGVVVGVISFNSVSISNAISSSGGTITGTLNVVGNLQQNGTDVNGFATAMAVAMGL